MQMFVEAIFFTAGIQRFSGVMMGKQKLGSQKSQGHREILSVEVSLKVQKYSLKTSLRRRKTILMIRKSLMRMKRTLLKGSPKKFL